MRSDLCRWIVPIVLSSVIAFGLEAGEGGERLGSLQQVCVTDQATGFNWEDGRWVRTQFKGGTYVVSKVESPNDPVEALRSGKLACGKLAAEETTFRTFNEFADGDHKMYGTCLRLHRVGHKNPEFMKCTELHSKKTGTWVVTFACGEANFYFGQTDSSTWEQFTALSNRSRRTTTRTVWLSQWATVLAWGKKCLRAISCEGVGTSGGHGPGNLLTRAEA